MPKVAFDTATFDPQAIAADAVALAELHGGPGHEQVRIDWLRRRLEHAPGSRSVDDVGNLVWTFGPPPYRLAVLVHVDDVFDAATTRGITQRDGWLCGPGIGDNAIAVATTVAVAERALSGPGPWPVAVVFQGQHRPGRQLVAGVPRAAQPAEPQGQRPQRLDRRIPPALLQVGQRGFRDVRAGGQGGQGHPAGGAEPVQVRRNDVRHIGEGPFRSVIHHASELYQ